MTRNLCQLKELDCHDNIGALKQDSWQLLIGSQDLAFSEVNWCLVIGSQDPGPWRSELVFGDWLSGDQPLAPEPQNDGYAE